MPFRRLAILPLVLTALPLQAEVNKVFSPTVEAGEWELEARGYVTEDDRNAFDGRQVNKLDVAVGVTDYWMTELELVYAKEPGDSQELEAYASENVFQFNERSGDGPVFGLFVELEKERDADLKEFVIGPIAQGYWGQWTGTANLFFEKQYGSDRDESGIETRGAAQLKYEMDEEFQPGVEYYGDDDEQHLGPALFGELDLGGHELNYEFAALAGLNDDTPDWSVRWMFELEL